MWAVPVAEEHRAFARAQRDPAGPLLVLSPLSSQRSNNFRNWATERYIDVCRHARSAHNAAIVVTGSGRDDEREVAAAICAAVGPGARSLVGATSLKSLFALIGEADVVIAPDSGPVHMAVAAGTPVIGLYATSNPGRTGPYLSRELVVDAYPEAVRRYLGRSVDAVRWGQRVRDPNALDLIAVSDVIARLDQVLGATSRG